MNLLVTGASGFIGRNVLLGMPSDWDIIAIYHKDDSFPAFLERHHLTHVKPVKADLVNPATLSVLCGQQFDACVYLAANGDPAFSAEHPVTDLNANAISLLNLVSNCQFGHFVFFSSGAVYDGLAGDVTPNTKLNPTLPYAISKWAAERYLHFAKRKGWVNQITIVRFFGAYGPFEPARKIYGRLVSQFGIERDPRFTLRGDGENLIDAMHVDDTVRAIKLLLEQAKEDQTLDLYSGSPLTLKSLVLEAAHTFGIKADISFVGEVAEYIQFRPIDKTMETEYGFKPSIPLQNGLQQFHRWIEENAILV